MIRSKLGLLGLCAMVLGVMAISASAAQAAGSWLVGSTEITGTSTLLANLEGELESTATLLTHLVTLSVSVTCTGFTTSNIHLAAAGKLTEGGKVVFTGCTSNIAGCLVKSPGAPVGTVESNEGKGELVLHEGGVVLTKIEPKSTTAGFAVLRFDPDPEIGCPLPESNKVNGTLYVKDCEGAAETLQVEHLIEQGPLTSLTVGLDTKEHLETSIDGSALVFLSGEHEGVAWRAMGV